MFKRAGIIAFALSLLLPFGALAQALDYKDIIARSTPVPLAFDTSFEQKHGRQLPLHFSVVVPTAPGEIRVAGKFDGSATYGSVTFYTPRDQLAEYLSLSQVRVRPGTPEERAQYLADMFNEQVLPGYAELPEYENVGIRNARIAGYPAVEMIGLYRDEKYGRIIIRVVGIFAPSGNRVLIAKSRTVVAGMPVPGVNEMNGTFVGRILESVKFLASRDENGDLVTF